MSSPGRRVRGQCILYVGAVLLFATGLAVALPGQDADHPGPVQVLTMGLPLVVYLILRRLRRIDRSWRSLGWRPALRAWPAAVLLPAAAVLPAYALTDLLGWCELDGVAAYLATSPLQIAMLTVLVLGEEVGWRGFLQPQLQQLTTKRRAVLLTGVTHGVFHVPLLVLTNGYDSDGSRWIVVPGVVAVLTAAGVIFGWLRDRTESLWPVAIAHASVNVFLLGSVEVMETDHPSRLAYLTGEGGALTLLATAAIAGVLLHRPWPGAASQADDVMLAGAGTLASTTQAA